MANLNTRPPRLAASQTPPVNFAESTVTRAPRTNQRYLLCGGSNAARAFRAETQPNFRYTSIQGAVPKW